MMDVSWLNALLVGAGCLALGYLIATRRLGRRTPFSCSSALDDGTSDGGENMKKKKNREKEPLEIEMLAEILEDFKMVCVLNKSRPLSFRCHHHLIRQLSSLLLLLLVIQTGSGRKE